MVDREIADEETLREFGYKPNNSYPMKAFIGLIGIIIIWGISVALTTLICKVSWEIIKFTWGLW